MNRQIKPGDRVRLTLSDKTSDFVIQQIDNLHIYITLPNSTSRSLIYPLNDRWVVYGGENLPYRIEFLEAEQVGTASEKSIEQSVEQLTKKEVRTSLTGQEWTDKLILEQLTDEELRSTCSTHPQIAKWCEDIWRDRIKDIDSGLVETKPEDKNYSEWYHIILGAEDSAIKGGYVDLIGKYIEDGADPRHILVRTLNLANEGWNQPQIIKFIIDNYIDQIQPQLGGIILYALVKEHPELLTSLVKHEVYPASHTARDAVIYGRVPVIEWFKSEGIIPKPEELRDLIDQGDLTTLKSIYHHYGVLPKPNQVALSCNVDLLDWLAQLGKFPTADIIPALKYRNCHSSVEWMAKHNIQ